MKNVELRNLVAVAIATTLLLAGCAPTAPKTDNGSGTSPSDSSGSESTPSAQSNGGAADCSTFDGQTDPELSLFTSSAITAGPAEGQVYGDGTELSVTLSQQAIDAGLLPLFELLALSPTGEPLLVSSLAFDPTTGGDGTYSTKTLEFGNDDLVGKAIVTEIFAISDATIPGAQKYGSKLLLGNYCMTYANDGS